MRRPVFRAVAAGAVLAALPLLAACEMSFGNLAGKATDDWHRTYQLASGGTIEVTNGNGRIDVEEVSGSTVDVTAERIAHAATDEAARELLPKIVIKDDAKPDRVSVETERIAGMMIGAGYEVRYHIKAPKGAVVRLKNTNGEISASGISGRLVAQTTNGKVVGHDLSGPVEAGTTNGSVAVDVKAVAPDGISLHTTNGSATVTVPPDAKADISASCTNGGISVSGLTLDGGNISRRHVDGRLNGGGPKIELHTTNGGVRIRSAAAAADSK